MADFVAVLRKTIDGLGETTPEMRARVYDKARATISAKLAAITPKPAPAVIERQKAALEQAIASLESEYAVAAPADPEDFESVIASLERQPAKPAKTAAAPARTPPPAANAPQAKAEPRAAAPSAMDIASDDELVASRASSGSLAGTDARKPQRSGRGGLVAVALIILVFAGAAGYAVWLNRSEVATMLGLGAPQPAAEQPAAPATPAPTPAVAEAPEAPAPAVDPAVSKFTQKLNPDGTEVDTGPADGEPGVGEGTSVAALTVPPPETPAPAATDATPAAQPEPPAAAGADPATPATMPVGQTPPVAAAPETPAAPAAPSEPQPAAVAVGQRAIYYEERTSAEGGSAQQGNIVWSLVQESPGGDKPAEAAIRADATIPGKDVQLRMTIRRNADPTLPASHIVELIFLTPENFDGGVIDNLLRMTMKETEEATGNPVIGLPAKIGDGFFLIALSDGAPEVEANMQLFRRMKWIDIPIVYRSGRRALMTLERGIPGDKIFEEAIQAWSQTNG